MPFFLKIYKKYDFSKNSAVRLILFLRIPIKKKGGKGKIFDFDSVIFNKTKKGKKMYIDKEKLKEQAKGHWLDILEALAPDFQEAIDECPKHVPCPFHGGKDGFRFFNDADETGMAICNTCGAFSPYKLLMEANDWDFHKTLREINNYLRRNK
jgi:hypothetical protein